MKFSADIHVPLSMKYNDIIRSNFQIVQYLLDTYWFMAEYLQTNEIPISLSCTLV